MLLYLVFSFFFFNETATTEIYTLSLHDALPIYSTNGTFVNEIRIRSQQLSDADQVRFGDSIFKFLAGSNIERDRKSTRLNSSHLGISYAVFCLKKKKNNELSGTIIDTSILTT